METPSVPGNGSGQVKQNAARLGGNAAGAGRSAGATAQAAAGPVAALPGRAKALARLVTLRRFLRAAPVAAAAVAGVAVGRLTAKRR
ncbi:hypothetical protein [Actinomadura geliboluensis]|jgi:hypothetical protein|uniref:hypothetical protein n=1 Tax=Actinomadura geliboluensis TaxID=882440 RepID=UPI0026076380|nr:hypothetical protein [Actinomadura geliboluensis]